MAAGEPQGLLDGVPTSIKDIVLTRGWVARRGSHTTEGDPPAAADAPATARLREAGAVLLGSTTTPEFGWKGVTDNPLGHVGRNPWDVTRTSGGSSGGAGIAAALGMGALHVGTDGGGSIRIPSSFCGIVGLKPTFGRVPAWPLSPFGTVAHIGPMTRTVADAALMLTVLSRPGPARLARAAPRRRGLSGRPGGGHGRAADRGQRGPGYVEVDPEVRATFEAALGVLADMGARVERVDPPVAGAAEHLRAYLVPRGDAPAGEIAGRAARAARSRLRRHGRAGRTLQPGGDPGRRCRAGELGVAMQRFLAEYDLLATPSTAMPAFAAGIEHPDPERRERWSDWAGFSYPFNLTQQPAISVPAGFTAARAADRAAAGRRQVCRRAGSARGAGVRVRLPAADAGCTARVRGLTCRQPHAWLAPAAPIMARQWSLGRGTCDQSSGPPCWARCRRWR